jgi:perosamine synthetase
MLRFSTFGPHISKIDFKYVKDAMKKSSWYQNPYKYCEKFEKEFAKYHKRKYALMTPNCTSAIHLFLFSLNLKKTDEIIAPESTWIASVSSVLLTKAKLVLCDVDYDTWCISIDEIIKKINKNTKVIISVNLFGNSPNYKRLEALCKKKKILLLEDAAESLGSIYNKMKSGKFGDVSVFSFHRTKTITTGEGGMMITDSKKIYLNCKLLRDHGRGPKTRDLFNDEFALKYMPFNLQAALGYSQFKKIKLLIKIKRSIFFEYKNNLKEVKNLIQFNQDDKNILNGCWATVIVFKEKNSKMIKKIINKLNKKGFFPRPFFYPISSLPAVKKFKDKSRIIFGKCKNASNLSKYGIVLPSSYILRKKDIKEICSILKGELIKYV